LETVNSATDKVDKPEEGEEANETEKDDDIEDLLKRNTVEAPNKKVKML
jgi:hypothetical protein